MKIRVHILLLLCILLISSCKKDEYVYPSVLTEFVDIETDNSGKLSYINCDNGDKYLINERSGLEGFKSDSIYRALSIFEPSENSNENTTATLYSCQFVVSVIPSTENKFPKGIKTDPLDIDRIWYSGNYINLVLDIMAKDKPHALNFIDNGITNNNDGSKILNITIYHDQNNDYKAYTKKAYASIPLWPYKETLTKGDKIIIHINTYKEGNTTREFYY